MDSYEDRQMFLEDLGLKESGVVRLIHSTYHLLNLATYFTAGVAGSTSMDDYIKACWRHRLQVLFIPILKKVLSVQK